MILIKAVFVYGRFNGPTCEHEKLIDLAISTAKENRCNPYIFVSGPTIPEDCNAKNPLTVSEKVAILETMYPAPRCMFVDTSTDIRLRTPVGALCSLWHKMSIRDDVIDITIIAGQGIEGVSGKNAGGSIEEYKDIILRLNSTKYPVRTNAMHQVVGGDYRMNYRNVRFIANPRGKVSGTVLRQAILQEEPDLEAISKMFASNMTPASIAYVSQLIRARSLCNEQFGNRNVCSS